MTSQHVIHGDPELATVLYSRLSQALNYPDAGLIEDLVSGSFTEDLGQALAGIGKNRACEAVRDLGVDYADPEPASGDRLLDLEKDYTRMCFASRPRQVYLFESVYREGKLLQDSTFEIARLYHDAGLKVDSGYDFPPDHIATELEFMGYLCFNEIKSIDEGDTSRRDYAQKLQQAMLANHLGPFAAQFARALSNNAATPFYRVMGETLSQVFSDFSNNNSKGE